MSTEKKINYPAVPTASIDEIEGNFLRSCRTGDLETVKNFLAFRDHFNINCKGRSKFKGWTPLHLATYFGHIHVVKYLLLCGADVNIIDKMGDTAAHKAAFIGRQDLVILLLQHNANVSIINSEGKLPRKMVPPSDTGRKIAKLLRAAEQAEILCKEEKMLSAARDGNINALKILLKDTQNPPNINCVNDEGNSCLHNAAYRGHKDIAALLLQNGVDTNIRNNMEKTASDLAKDPQMKRILSVMPVRKVQKNVNRFEGPLLRRSRFLGWRPIWAVLERGVLNYYATRADSTGINESKRRDYKYLDSARITMLQARHSFVVHFGDGSMHRLSVLCNDKNAPIERQKWINSLQEHAAYSAHYLRGSGQRHIDSDIDDSNEVPDLKPLGSMSDAFSSASASLKVLQRQLSECTNGVEQLQQNISASSNMGGSSTLPTTLMHFQNISETATDMVASLRHCLNLFQQQEDLRILLLKEEKEKRRVMEEILNALGKEHNHLEKKVASHLSVSSQKGEIAINASLESNDDHDDYDCHHDDDDDRHDDKFHEVFHDADFIVENYSVLNSSDDDDDDDDDDFSLMTAAVYNSPSESMRDLRSIPIAPNRNYFIRLRNYFMRNKSMVPLRSTTDYPERKSKSNGNSDDDDSEHTLAAGTSMASCSTYISDDGSTYKNARSDLFFPPNNESELIDFCESIPCDQLCSVPTASFNNVMAREYHRQCNFTSSEHTYTKNKCKLSQNYEHIPTHIKKNTKKTNEPFEITTKRLLREFFCIANRISIQTI